MKVDKNADTVLVVVRQDRPRRTWQLVAVAGCIKSDAMKKWGGTRRSSQIPTLADDGFCAVLPAFDQPKHKMWEATQRTATDLI
jgi:hypothetical protein